MVRAMSETKSIRGALQQEIMRVLWRAESASVYEVREALPRARRGAYTTVQTVLNRLAERGLVARRRQGRAFRYAARISESDYVAGTLESALSGASEEARRAALSNLAERLSPEDLEALRKASARIKRRRGS